jgi:hypothetical protein
VEFAWDLIAWNQLLPEFVVCVKRHSPAFKSLVIDKPGQAFVEVKDAITPGLAVCPPMASNPWHQINVGSAAMGDSKPNHGDQYRLGIPSIDRHEGRSHTK